MFCVCTAFDDRKKKCSKSYRSFRGSNRSNCCTSSAPNASESPFGNAASIESQYNGGRGLDDVRTGAQSNFNSRARPLYIPSSERQGYNNESHNESQGWQWQQYQQPQQHHNLHQQKFTDTRIEFQQPKRQERPTELLLSTKQFENGHTNTKSQIKSTYMEQFWICAKRLAFD